MRIGPLFAKLFVAANALVMAFLILVQARIITLPAAYDPYATPILRDTPSWLTNTRLQTIDADPDTCLESLNTAGLKAALLPAVETSEQCHLENTVMMGHLSKANLKPERTRCAIAARLYMWERHVLQPLAQQTYGEGIKQITHFGSYNCRTIHNSNHMSEHSTANALDISGVVLNSGRSISVKQDWDGNVKDSAFLHAAHDGLCQYFNLTLSPDYNADHEDHFHVDMGRVKNCR